MKKSAKHASRYDGDLSFVRDFLQRLVENTPSSSVPHDFSIGRTLIKQDEGMLTLDSNEYRDYLKVRAELNKKLAPEGDLSPSTIDFALREAIFTALDIRNRSGADAKSRVKEAVLVLHDIRNQPSEPFECWLEIGGLDPNSLPSSFGRVRFVVFTDYQIRRLSKRSKTNLSALLDARTERLLGSCFAIAESRGRDIRAATTLAMREVQATVECLNFFSDMLDYNHSWLFLPGDQKTTVTTKIAFGDHGRFTVESKAVGPMGGYDVKRLRSQPNIRGIVKRISRLLQKRGGEVDELLLKALRWAGRATVAPLRNEAFMLYAIALECVVLPGSDRGELRHRLSQRVAKVTQDTVAKRTETQKLIGRLYDVRSKIVHTGLYAVNEDELYRMRNVAKGVILTLLKDTRVAGLNTAGQLDQWYEDRMLKG